MGKLTDKVAKGVFWVMLEKFGVQAAHFVVTLVLARLLTPSDYGTVALLSVFITIANVLVDCGFAKALVRKKDATQTDYNTVFYLSMVFAVVLYAVLFFAAPLVADFYGIPDLKVMLRVLALTLVFHSINGVQNVELNRKMLFHLSFRISWVRTIVSAVTGISFAYAGYGPWALVWASFAGGVAGVVARQLVIRWRPSLTFSWESAKGLFRYGWKMTAAGLVNAVCNNITGLVIGKVYTRADLAFYKKGDHTPHILTNSLDATLGRVSFPALVRLQDDPVKLRNALRRMIKCSTFLVFPMMAAVAVLAKPLILAMFGKQWLPCVPYMQLYCIICACRPFSTVNLQAILAYGHSGTYLALIIIRRVLGLTTLALTIKLGVLQYLFWAVIVSGPVGVLINAIPNWRLLGYSWLKQFLDILPALLMSLVAWGAVFAAQCVWPFRAEWFLAVGVPLGFSLYLALALVFRAEPLAEFAQQLLKYTGRMPSLDRALAAISRRCGK